MGGCDWVRCRWVWVGVTGSVVGGCGWVRCRWVWLGPLYMGVAGSIVYGWVWFQYDWNVNGLGPEAINLFTTHTHTHTETARLPPGPVDHWLSPISALTARLAMGGGSHHHVHLACAVSLHLLSLHHSRREAKVHRC